MAADPSTVPEASPPQNRDQPPPHQPATSPLSLSGRFWLWTQLYWPYLLVTLATLVLRWPTLSNRILSIDEPDYFAQAARLRSFYAFVYAFYYRLETKTQIGLVPYLIGQALDGRNAVLIVRIIGILCILASCWLLIAFAQRFLGGRLPGLVAALLWLPYLEIGPGYDLVNRSALEYFPAPKLEYFELPFILASLYSLARGCAAVGMPSRRPLLWLLTAGAALGVAVLIKPLPILLGLVYVAAVFLWIPQAARRQRQMVPAVRASAIFILGGVVPLAVVFLPYLFNPPARSELLFNLTEVSGSYVENGAAPLFRLQAMLLYIPPWLLLAFFLVPYLASRRARYTTVITPARVLPIVALIGPVLFLTSLAGCTCPYYLIPVIPFLLLTVSGYLSWILGQWADRAGSGRAWLVGMLLVVMYLAPTLPALLSFPARAAVDWYRAEDRATFDVDGLLAYIERHTSAGSPIWVYYNTPEIYLWSQRPPATRDPQADWLTFVAAEPWFTRTRSELAAERPALIVAIQRPHPSLARPRAPPFTGIPVVSDWIQSHYDCRAGVIAGAVICQPQGP